MLKTGCALVALIALANPALAAATCASPADTAALKTAVMQQELMVAALQCHETGAYNRFVITYRGELQDSDATLKSFFVRRGGEHGEAGYDAFKTKAANLSALEEARDSRNFCADAHALFAAAMDNHGSLASFVTARATDIGDACAQSRPVIAVADKPPIAAPTRPVTTVKIADVHGAQADMTPKPATDSMTVPDHATPMMPWRQEQAPRAARDDHDDEEDYAPPARATAISDQRDDGYYGNAPYADRPEAAHSDDQYGPPPGWYPPRRYRPAPPPNDGW